MTKQLFDRSLLEFIYFLTRAQKYQSTRDMALAYSEYLTRPITEKTIRRWIKILSKPVFKYWPNARYENLGLMQAFVITSAKNEGLINVLPYKIFFTACFDVNTLQNKHIIFYAFPHNRKSEFEKFWRAAKKAGAVGNYEIFYHKGNVTIYSPHHEIVNHRGYVEIKKDYGADVAPFIDILREEIHNEPKYNLTSAIKKYPIIVPLVLENYNCNYRTSKSLWHALRARLGNAIWDYIPNGKAKSNGAGIKHLWSVQRYLNDYFSEHFRQVRAEYEPLYSNENITLYILAKLFDVGKLPEFAEEISRLALNTNIRLPIAGSNIALIHITTSNKEAMNIQSNILPRYLDGSFDNKVFWLNYDESYRLWMQDKDAAYKVAYWDVFDPVRFEWKWEQEKYLKELRKLTP